MARLMSASSDAWLQGVLADFNSFLGDHANCERKAAAMALSLVSRFADRHELVDAMLELAQEELLHFQQVFRLMRQRQLNLVPETKDLYVGALRRLVRSGRREQLLDLLCVAGVVEARGCERFGRIAEALPPGPDKDFYLDITRSEARHGGLFVRLARRYYEGPEVEARLAELFVDEAQILAALPLRAALH